MTQPIPINVKVQYFEFVLYKLLDWYGQNCGQKGNNDISILKALKLLFFVSAARADVDSRFNLVDGVFDNFWAMPYGHVELSIYDYIKQHEGLLHFYHIDDIKTTELKPFSSAGLDAFYLSEIERSIEHLKVQNPSLICLPAFALVDLSHTWYSWQYNYKRAEMQGRKREQINPETIKSEDKFFSLLAF